MAEVNFGVSHKKDFEDMRTENQLDAARWEAVKELGAGDARDEVGEELNHTDETGNPNRRKLKATERAIQEESARKTELNLRDDAHAVE
jgi:hypothetical protein